jgi:hypothetical protein
MPPVPPDSRLSLSAEDNEFIAAPTWEEVERIGKEG